MTIDLSFQSDGKVRVFAMYDGEVVSITCTSERLCLLLPIALYREVKGRISQLDSIMVECNRVLKAVN